MIIKHSRQLILVFIAIISLLFLYLVPSEHYIIKSFFRVIPMVAFLYYAILRMPTKKLPIHILMMIGFLFSIAGDAVYYWPILEFLLAPAAILDGYIFYSIGFFTRIKFSLMRLLTIIPIFIFGYILIHILFKELDNSRTGFLIFLIFVYLLFAAIMCWSAFMTGNKWVMGGALLFIISDTIRSLNLFVSEGSYSELLIILPYFGAQFLIAHSIGTFSNKNKKVYLK